MAMNTLNALEYIAVEALIRQRRARTERERAYFQGKKDLARILRVLVLENEDEIQSVLIWLMSSDAGNAPDDPFTKTEQLILDKHKDE